MRDAQRQRVYNAESASGLHVNEIGWEWEDTVAFGRKILDSKYTQKKWGRKGVPIEFVKGRGGGRYWSPGHRWSESYYAWVSHGHEIHLGVWARSKKLVIIHEIAHFLAGAGHGHDWKFCEIELDLVRHFLGKEAYDTLKASFKKNKVRYTKPVKRNLSPEQRQALSDRMAAVRAAKQKSAA
jgi:putative metallohydrolase (TIGR04338 family)